ncbi:hypothetical protein LCGC14_0887240 [marine sediment metagenome]|uniref:Uncharacterized protein n=1 Tax=marine sediment metagenome TaxID=412755 RepID=A0A0F9S755_9ZZZZ
MDVYQRIVRDLKSGRCNMKYGECSGEILYSYDSKHWFKTPMSAYKANVPGSDPAVMLRRELMAEFS